MVWVVALAASVCILSDRLLGSLVLIDKVEIDIVDHCLLFAHVAGAGRLDGPEATSANFVVNSRAVVHATAVWNGVQLLLPDASWPLT